MSKFEQLLDLLVNEQKDEAEKLFHEIVVEKSRDIYEGLADETTTEATEERQTAPSTPNHRDIWEAKRLVTSRLRELAALAGGLTQVALSGSSQYSGG